jgi:hypothetical protein
MQPGDVISYMEMSLHEGTNLQRGMNFHLKSGRNVILMSVRRGAPYADHVEDEGRTLIYEGHDLDKRFAKGDPKLEDQPLKYPGGSFTANGLFFEAARRYREGRDSPEIVQVYEKLKEGIWVYNGPFELVDAQQVFDGRRNVFKFRLVVHSDEEVQHKKQVTFDHTRLIPSAVKVEVWKRDEGKCVNCGSNTNLHFDHVLPYSKGGTSLLAENIQLLCASCNLAKHDRIE